MGWRRRIAVVVAVPFVAALVVAGWAVWRTEAHLRTYDPPTRFTTAIPTDAAAIARGKHLAQTRGCFGCHGDRLQGEVFDETPWYDRGRAVAPSLTKLVRTVDAATFEAALRQGIGHDGRALYSMPSFNFARLSDGDTADLLAFLRAAPVVEAKLPAGYLGWAIRWDIATGRDAAIPAFVAQVPLLARRNDPSPQVRLGEYLAMTSCNECHGFDLRGEKLWSPPGKGPPDLAGAHGYSREQFFRLMRTGMPPDNRDLRLMDTVARGRFVHWSDTEVDALYAYLSVLGQ